MIVGDDDGNIYLQSEPIKLKQNVNKSISRVEGFLISIDARKRDFRGNKICIKNSFPRRPSKDELLDVD